MATKRPSTAQFEQRMHFSASHMVHGHDELGLWAWGHHFDAKTQKTRVKQIKRKLPSHRPSGLTC